MTSLADLVDDHEVSRDAISAGLNELGVATQLPGPLAALDDLSAQLENAIDAFLHRPVEELIGSAWDKHEAIHQARHDTRDTPGATSTVVLAHQNLTSTQRATIDVEFRGIHYRLLELLVTVTLQIDTVPITIQAGEITRIGTADAIIASDVRLATRNGDKSHLICAAPPTRLTLPGWDYTPLTR